LIIKHSFSLDRLAVTEQAYTQGVKTGRIRCLVFRVEFCPESPLCWALWRNPIVGVFKPAAFFVSQSPHKALSGAPKIFLKKH
jgi:hypothetical protein